MEDEPSGSSILALILLLSAGVLSAQPAAYAPRGVRAYLVNYGAVHGDRFLAEFAARRFVLIDEAGSTDIPMMRAITPDARDHAGPPRAALSRHGRGVSFLSGIPAGGPRRRCIHAFHRTPNLRD